MRKSIPRHETGTRQSFQCTRILLDPGTPLNRLGPALPGSAQATRAASRIDRSWHARKKEMALYATEKSQRFHKSVTIHSLRGIRPLIVLLALTLSGCGEKPTQPAAAAAAAPPVTVAQPTRRTVTDWDEFTGRFDAVEEVQVRARVGGFVTSVEFKDGDMVHTGDLLYVIDSRPFEAVAEQADGQLADARAKAELAKRELDRGLNLVQTSAVSEQAVDQRRQALQAAHAAETQAEGALKAAQLNIEFTHVSAVIPNKDLSILPGQFGRVRLIGSSPYEALLLPDTAIATDQSRKIVFVVKDDDTVEAKPVVLGPLDEGLRVIREGLKAEDRVIVDGLQRARVGAKVTPHVAQAAPAGGKT